MRPSSLRPPAFKYADGYVEDMYIGLSLPLYFYMYIRLTTQDKETVMFKFNDQGWTHSQSTGQDNSMEAASHAGMQLGDFLERPVKIADATWTGTGFSVEEINPWDAFLSHPTVMRKIANYKLLKGKLCVKFVINGSPFLYGKGLVAYHPLRAYDDFAPPNTTSRLCRLSQRQHIYLNPTTSSGGELVLPFFWPYNAVNIPTHEWDSLGEITLTPASTLKHAAGETAQCTVSVFAWMEEPKLMQPTSSVSNTFVGQSSENEKKVVSKVATAVGDTAEMLSHAPIIGPYARATEEVARMVGRLSDLFGFSKPRGTYDLADYRARHLGTLATTNDKDMARPLTLDIKAENTIDPRTVGLDGKDEMSIPYLCSKESLVTRFTWNVGQSPDTELFRIPITPYIRSTFPTDTVMDLPPAAYIASLFEHWRGTLQYRFIVNCSNFHRGKLRIRYEPYNTDPGGDYNVVQSEIVDLSEYHDHKCEIGWGADRNYLKVTDNAITPSVPDVTSTNLNIHNGVLVVSVASGLTVPDEASEDEIEILVAMNCCEDIEFAIPTEKIISQMSLVADVTNTDPPVDPGIVVYPQPVSSLTGTKCGMFYYGWHTNNFHNNQGYLRDKLLDGPDGSANKQFPAVPGIAAGEYDDTNRSVVRAQFNCMLKAGVDHVVYSWWGPGSREETQFQTALKPELGTVADGTMKACAFYESTRLKQNGAWVMNTTAVNQLRADMIHLKTTHCNDSNYLERAFKNNLVSGKVIYIYLLRAYSDSDKALFLQTIINVFEDSSIGGYSETPYLIGDLMFGTPRAFGGSITSKLGAMGVYDVYGQSQKGNYYLNDADVKSLHSNYKQWKNLNPAVHCIPTIGPGYNDRGVRLEANHPALARSLAGYDKGSLFKAHLKYLEEESLEFNNEWFTINSWNEWHEDSNIEPCGGAAATTHPVELTNGVEYEPYGTKYVNFLGEWKVGGGYVAQSSENEKFVGQSNEEERENEHAPETDPDVTILEKPVTYHSDDLIFFGEKIASLRALMKRYTRFATITTSSTRRDKMKFTTFPHYLWDAPISGTLETLLTRIGVLYLGRRGGTRWKAIPDFRNSTPRISSVALNEKADTGVEQDISETQLIGYGWNGVDVVTGVYNPVLEWEVPYYSDRRFQHARSLQRNTERGHEHRYDGAAVFRNHYMCAAGDDFQLFYYAGTPSVSFA